MKKILFVILFSSVFFYAKAQQPVYQWAKTFGSTYDDYGMSVTTDKDGNVYTTGNFSGIVDFDPGAGIYNLTSVGGGSDIFVCKLNKSGNFIWAKSMGGAYGDQGWSIATDISGNIYTTGTFSSTADFDPGPNNFYMTAGGNSNVFISKLDSAGNFIWARSINCPLGSDYGFSICTDAHSNVYTTGYYSGTADFDPGLNVYNYTSNGVYDIFLSKLDSNGNFVWAKSIGSSGWDCGFSITADTSGNVYSTGTFVGSVDFDPGAAIYNLSTTASSAIYIMKLDTAGNFVWAKSFSGASGHNQGNDITLDSMCNIYTTGSFNDTVDFDPGPGIFNAIGYSSFISKLDSAGNFIFAKSFNGGSPSSICLDKKNNIYTTGDFPYTTDFDPGIGVYNLIPTTWAHEDIFISKLDSLGNFSWAVSVGGIGNDLGKGIAVDSEGSVLTTGIFNYAVDFNPGPGINNLTVLGSLDAFVLKLKQCFPSTHSLSVAACNAYTFNGYTHTSSGVYYDTLINATGCDSIIILNLTVLNASSHTVSLSSCMPYYFNGQTLTSSGIYYDTLTNAAGCDSLITLNLTINSSSDTINQSSCTSWVFNGATLTLSGMYTDTLLNTAGCDSVITLNLTINQATSNNITTTACNNYYFNGLFLTSGGTYYDTLTNAIGCDSILTLDLVISNQSSYNTLSKTSCNVFNFNGQQLTSSGVYIDTLINAVGCDSILTLYLNIISYDTSISQSGFSMWSNLPMSSLSSYQWINCKDNSVIMGATSQGFTTTTNGSYAVIINYSGCIDTSDCRSIFSLGLENSDGMPAIQVYPNPSHGMYTLVAKNKLKDASLKIYNLTGESIFSEEGLCDNFLNFDISGQLKGFYMLEIREHENVYRFKIIKN